jgi:hypothetical protein
MPKLQPHSVDSQKIIVDEITLDGRKVAVRNEEIPITRVRLDPQNPRIANTIALRFEAKGNFEPVIEELLWSDKEVHDLYRQVLVNRGLIERIIVTPDSTVVEGNCRVIVYRRLHRDFPGDRQWTHIPSRVLPEEITKREIALLLAQLHVQGKNEWSSFEKAGHVYRLHKEFVLTQDEIAVRLRMSKSKVNQLIRAFEAMRTVFLPKYPDPANVHKFSYFEELFKKPELREWAMTETDAVQRFSDWIGTGKLSHGVQVRDLPTIFANLQVMAAFEQGGYSEAKKVLEEYDPSISSPLFRKMIEMTEALREARLDDIHRARREASRAGNRIVCELKEALDRFIQLSGGQK